MNSDTQLLPESIEMRALAHMEKGVETIEAVKLAFEEEEHTIWLLMGVDMKTGASCKQLSDDIVSAMSKTIYDRINSPSLPIKQ
jgi:hypothetical protein